MSDSDKRRYPRVEATISAAASGGGTPLFHTVENLSLGGVSIKAPAVERVGTLIELRLYVEGIDSEPIECMGEVVWSCEGEEGRMGVKFTRLPAIERERLRAFLATLDVRYR